MMKPPWCLPFRGALRGGLCPRRGRRSVFCPGSSLRRPPHWRGRVLAEPVPRRSCRLPLVGPRRKIVCMRRLGVLLPLLRRGGLEGNLGPVGRVYCDPFEPSDRAPVGRLHTSSGRRCSGEYHSPAGELIGDLVTPPVFKAILPSSTACSGKCALTLRTVGMAPISSVRVQIFRHMSAPSRAGWVHQFLPMLKPRTASELSV